jgi:GT2 family glycosyltransferase
VGTESAGLHACRLNAIVAGRLRFRNVQRGMSVQSIKTPLPGWRIEGASTSTFSDCSLIIATYQRPNEVLELVERIDELSSKPFEVIVVDGSPGWETEEKLRSWTAQVKADFDLTYVKCPAGLTRQRNAGIDLTSGNYVFFLDDDCLPQANYFAEIRRVFHKDTAGKVGAVSGLISNEMQAPLSLRWRMRLALGLVPRLSPGIYDASGTSLPANMISAFSGLREIDCLSGCAMTFRRAVFNQHRFSEFFSGYSQGEDLEMSLRIRRHWTILWCGDAHAIHCHAPGGRPPSFRKGVMEVHNRYFIWKRHRPDVARLDRLRFWLDIAFLVAFDLLSFCRYPRQVHHLSHAGGLVRGAIHSLFRSPSYQEPLTQTRYELQVTG